MNVNDKIEQFIIWDCIDLLEKLEFSEYLGAHFGNVHRIAQIQSKFKYPIQFFDFIYNCIFYPFLSIGSKHANHKNSSKIAWYSMKNSSIIYDLKKSHYNVILIPSGIKDRLSAVEHFMWYFGLTNLFSFISNYILTKDVNYLADMLIQIEEKMKKNRPDYIILQGDSLPVERAIILASRSLGITTINIQDGIYQSSMVPIHGHATDYVLVWGQYFKDMYVNQGIRKADEVYVLGYPHKIEENINLNKSNNYIVYYLGQNYETYDMKYLDIKLNTLDKINIMCLKYGMQFYYRPHPGDDRKILHETLPHINFTPRNETLTQAYSIGDIFISFSSTTLIEASIRSKLCIQLRNYPIPCDNLEELGVCSKSVDNIEDLENYIDIIVKYGGLGANIKFNNEYIDITKNPSESLIDILIDIEKIKQSRVAC